jgi:hypothetical protein
MAMLIGDEWPTTIAEVGRKVRLEVPDRLQSRLKLQWPEANCPRTSIALAVYLSVFQRMSSSRTAALPRSS